MFKYFEILLQYFSLVNLFYNSFLLPNIDKRQDPFYKTSFLCNVYNQVNITITVNISKRCFYMNQTSLLI